MKYKAEKPKEKSNKKRLRLACKEENKIVKERGGITESEGFEREETELNK